MKIDRLLGILAALLRRDKVTAPFLAEKFEVSRRTISRDIETLCMAGIPIVAEQGRNGGISIAPGYTFPAFGGSTASLTPPTGQCWRKSFPPRKGALRPC